MKEAIRRRIPIVLGFWVVLLGQALAAPAAGTAAISLDPAVGPPTSQVTVTGSGFGSNERILVRFDAVNAGRGTSDADGAFSIPVAVPSSALPGDHKVWAKGKISGSTAQATFTVRTDWTQLQFTPDHLGVNPYENVVSPVNVGRLQELWSTELPGYVQGEPAVVDRVAYVGGQTKRADALTEAVDASTGELLWTQGVKHGTRVRNVAVWEGLVIAAPDGAYFTRAYDALTGAEAWTFDADGIMTEPVISGGVLYTASNRGTLYALDPTTGIELWRSTVTPLGVFAAVAVADGTVFVGANGVAAAYDAVTGAQLWFVSIGWELASPTVAGGVVYMGSLGGGVYALSEDDGTLLWNFTPADYVAAPLALWNEILYFGSANDSVYAIDAANATVVWEHLTGGNVGTAIVANGVVYTESLDGQVYAFDATMGDVVWQFSLGGAGADSVSISDGVLYVSAFNGHLYAFGLE